ncbi:MAG: hypothetical protein QW197_03775 [Candidatus Aenigmatarchaeota archaeon]
MSGNLRNKVRNVAEYLQSSYYIHASNIEIDGWQTNVNILLSLSTALVNGKQLIVGTYGIGKTTLAEATLSSTLALPIQFFMATKLSGHPGHTYETMIARPNLAALNQGLEEVIWSLFVQSPGKIVDEINRLPPARQTELLDGVDRNIFVYLNKSLFLPPQPFFATANYPDPGTSSLVPPLLDRFNIVTEFTLSPFAGKICWENTKKEELMDDELSKKAIDILLSDKPYPQKLKELEVISYEFYKGREKIVLHPQELKEIRQKIKEIKPKEEAVLFTTYIRFSLYDPYSGEKRPGESHPDENHYKKYPTGKITNPLSQRFFNSVALYSKIIAWLKGRNEVDTESVLSVLPYTLAHRVTLPDDYLQEVWKKRNDVDNPHKEMLNLFASYEIAKELYLEFKSMKDEVEEALDLAKKGRKDKIRELASRKDHPFFKGLEHMLFGIRKF